MSDKQVTVDEIIQTLYASGEPSLYSLRYDLAERIKQHGIAPPDGWKLVPVEPTEAMILAVNYFPEDLIKEREAQGYTDYRTQMTAAWQAESISKRQMYKDMLSAVKEKE